MTEALCILCTMHSRAKCSACASAQNGGEKHRGMKRKMKSGIDADAFL